MSKYGNRKITVDGKIFDSVHEAERYKQLRLMEQAGKIRELETQRKFELIPAQYETYERYSSRGKRLQDGRRCVEKGVGYVADFVYRDESGALIVEDTKGYRKGTAYDVFVIKRKLMRHIHGIAVKEV